MVAATVLVTAAIVAVAAFVTYRYMGSPPAAKKPATSAPAPSASASAAPAPAPQSPAPNDLKAEFSRFAATLPAKVGIAFGAAGGGQDPTAFGDWTEGPAWSTSKVPLVITAFLQTHPPQITADMRAAIVESDNAAAESVWASLGEPEDAAQQVDKILRESGDSTTTVESKKIRPEFTAFGQTRWSLENQVRFMAGAFCNSRYGPVFDLMSQIEAGQSWGLGTLSDTVFKGGWGPSASGRYLVRQMGVLSGKVAVAIATEPNSGQFNDGAQQLDQIATWLKEHFAALPVGQCGR